MTGGPSATVGAPLNHTMVPEIYNPILRATSGIPRLPDKQVQWRDALLLRSTNWLGDALMTLPATHKMSAFVPDTVSFCVLCPAQLAPLWQAAPWVRDVIAMRGKRVSGSEARRIREANSGVAVVLPNSFGAAWDVFLKGIPVRVGRMGRGRGWMLTHRLPEWSRDDAPADRHQLSRYLELASVFGDMPWDSECPPLAVDHGAEKAGELGLTATSGQWLAVAPGAAYGPAKQWPAERFAAVAAWWRQEVGPVVVVGTDRDRAAARAVRDRVPDALDLAGATDLQQLMGVLSVVDAVLANDSGAMHLAAALGRKGVAVFGSTDPVATGPIGGTWVLLRNPPECAPCFRRTCPRRDLPYECLRRIEAEDAVRALTVLLDGKTPGTGASRGMATVHERGC